MSITEVRSDNATDKAVAAKVDMKFEIVVIPVSDIDRAKEFYGRLGWRLDADYDNGKDFRVIQFTPPGSGCSVIFGKNVTAAAPGSAQDLYLIVSDIEATRKELLSRDIQISQVFHDAGGVYAGRMNRTCSGGSGSAVRIPSIVVTVRSPRSMIRTVTAGCSRRSQLGWPVASTPQRRPLHRRTIWRARFGVQKPPTESTKRTYWGDSAMKTGLSGMPHTWWRNRLGRRCRGKRLRPAIFLKGGVSCRGISMPSSSGPARQARLWLRGLRPRA